MSSLNTHDRSLIPALIGCIELKILKNLPKSLPYLQDCTFITKIRVVCHAKMGTDPLQCTRFTPPPTNHPCGATPTSGCFILTFIGKWNDIKKWNYSALKYTVSHIHDNDKNDKATINALQEMGRHLNACFTHPIAQEMINTTNGCLSSSYINTIRFGLVIDDDTATNNNDNGKITYIDPPNPSKRHTADNVDTSYRNTPSIGWLCLFVIYGHKYWFHLPIVDLSLHTEFMNTYNPNDLPPAEAFAYRALIDKWKNEQCVKEISDWMPRPNELNPYTYLEAWAGHIQQFYDEQQEQKQKEQEEKLKVKQAQEYFDEYKRLYLQQQTLDITSYIQQQQHQQRMIDNGDNKDAPNNIDPSLITTLSSTLYNEYYAKYLYNQLNDLKTMNHLQSHQYQQLSDAKLRYSLHHGYIHNTPRKHIALPSTLSSSSTTSTSQIDTLIDLATTTPPTLPTSTSSSSLSLSVEHDNIMWQDPHHQQQQNLAILHHQYNVLDEQKHILQIQYDELSTLLQYTIDNKDNEIQSLKEQITALQKQNQKEIDILNNKIIALEQQMKILIEQHQDAIKQLTEQHQETIQQLNEQYIKEKEEQYNTLQQQHNNILPTTQRDALTLLMAKIGGNNNNNITNDNITNDTITFLKEQMTTLHQHLQSKDAQHQKQLQLKDAQYQKQLDTKDAQYQKQLDAKDQQIKQIIESKDRQLESKDKQLEAKDQQIALLMQMLSNMTNPSK